MSEEKKKFTTMECLNRTGFMSGGWIGNGIGYAVLHDYGRQFTTFHVFMVPIPKRQSPPSGSLSFGTRMKNMFINNFRGIIGSIPIIIIPIYLISSEDIQTKPSKTALVLWILMFFVLLIHPVMMPVTALLPIFLLAIFHVSSSDTICKALFAANVALMVAGAYLRLLLNCSGVDKRLTCWFLCKSPDSSLTSTSLVIKASLAAYVVSVFSERLHAIPYLMHQAVAPLADSQGGEDPNLLAMQHILCNAIVTSSVFGSLAVVNGGWTTLVMRAMWEMQLQQDVFNFLDYSVFAIPTTLIMFGLNLLYNILLVKKMGAVSQEVLEGKVRSSVIQEKNNLPADRRHETKTIVFTAIILLCYFTRWSSILYKITGKRGWCDQGNCVDAIGFCKIPDVTITAIFLLTTSIFPIKVNFLKCCSAKKRSDLGDPKAELAVLTWKLADKSANYGFMLLTGAFIVIMMAMKTTKCREIYFENSFKFITNQTKIVRTFLLAIISVLLCNVVTSIGAAGMLLAVYLNATDLNYSDTLVIGVATAMAFASPFKTTPAYFSHSEGHVPLRRQIVYAIGSCIISTLVAWLAVSFFAPAVFQPFPKPPPPPVPGP